MWILFRGKYLSETPKAVSKGGKDRSVNLKKQIDAVVLLHKDDLKEGFGEVYIPEALARKYRQAPKETAWQYVFPVCWKLKGVGQTGCACLYSSA